MGTRVVVIAVNHRLGGKCLGRIYVKVEKVLNGASVFGAREQAGFSRAAAKGVAQEGLAFVLFYGTFLVFFARAHQAQGDDESEAKEL